MLKDFNHNIKFNSLNLFYFSIFILICRLTASLDLNSSMPLMFLTFFSFSRSFSIIFDFTTYIWRSCLCFSSYISSYFNFSNSLFNNVDLSLLLLDSSFLSFTLLNLYSIFFIISSIDYPYSFNNYDLLYYTDSKSFFF